MVGRGESGPIVFDGTNPELKPTNLRKTVQTPSVCAQQKGDKMICTRRHGTGIQVQVLGLFCRFLPSTLSTSGLTSEKNSTECGQYKTRSIYLCPMRQLYDYGKPFGVAALCEQQSPHTFPLFLPNGQFRSEFSPIQSLGRMLLYSFYLLFVATSGIVFHSKYSAIHRHIKLSSAHTTSYLS